MVQDRNGKQLRRFHVAIDGDVVGDTLTLHERFIYDDGEKAAAGMAHSPRRRPPL
ncbi:lipoprotein [Klebsiella michiganensis]|nr:lipoprotein [Klebsiella michiganensis]